MRTRNALSALLTASLLAIAAAPVHADDPHTLQASGYCASRGDLGLSHGACVAYFTAGNVVPHDTVVCRDPSIQRRLGVENHGQCVERLQEMHGREK